MGAGFFPIHFPALVAETIASVTGSSGLEDGEEEEILSELKKAFPNGGDVSEVRKRIEELVASSRAGTLSSIAGGKVIASGIVAGADGSFIGRGLARSERLGVGIYELETIEKAGDMDLGQCICLVTRVGGPGGFEFVTSPGLGPNGETRIRVTTQSSAGAAQDHDFTVMIFKIPNPQSLP